MNDTNRLRQLAGIPSLTNDALEFKKIFGCLPSELKESCMLAENQQVNEEPSESTLDLSLGDKYCHLMEEEITWV